MSTSASFAEDRFPKPGSSSGVGKLDRLELRAVLARVSAGTEEVSVRPDEITDIVDEGKSELACKW